jgi:hypothetical protein
MLARTEMVGICLAGRTATLGFANSAWTVRIFLGQPSLRVAGFAMKSGVLRSRNTPNNYDGCLSGVFSDLLAMPIKSAA